MHALFNIQSNAIPCLQNHVKNHKVLFLGHFYICIVVNGIILICLSNYIHHTVCMFVEKMSSYHQILFSVCYFNILILKNKFSGCNGIAVSYMDNLLGMKCAVHSPKTYGCTVIFSFAVYVHVPCVVYMEKEERRALLEKIFAIFICNYQS